MNLDCGGVFCRIFPYVQFIEYGLLSRPKPAWINQVLWILESHKIRYKDFCILHILLFDSFVGHDDVIKWKHFPRNWPFVREIHRSPVNFPHKGQWRGALMFSLIYSWINDWINNREAGDLRPQHGHYDVIVMECGCTYILTNPLVSSDVHMHQETKPTSVQMVVCRLFGAELLSKAMLLH